MAKTIESLFYYGAFISDIILALVFFLFLFKNKKINATWYILAYTLINLLINGIVEFFPFKGIYLVYSCFTLIEYGLFAGFIFQFIKNKNYKRTFLILSALFIIFLPIYYSTTKQGKIDSIPIGIETLFILLFAFYYFYEQMNDMENHYIYYRFHFWIIIGMMLYLAGSFFIYIFANHVDKQTLRQFWSLTYFFYVVKNIFFLIGILNYSNRSKNPTIKDQYPYLN